MALSLADLRTRTLEHLDLPRGGRWADVAQGFYGKLDALINDAYLELVLEMDSSPNPLDLVPTPLSVSVTSAAREYPLTIPETSLDPAPSLRKITDVEYRGSDVSRWRSVGPVSWGDRNAAKMHGGMFYTFRARTGVHYLGLVPNEPEAMTLRVYYTIVPRMMVNPGDVPTHLPDLHHRLIAYVAALSAKQVENREPGLLTGLYNKAHAQFISDCSRPLMPGRPIPI